MNNFLTYDLGPLRKASPAIAKMHEIEKHVVNLAGATTIAPNSRTAKNMKKPAAPRQTAPHIKLLSLLMKLKIESHPCGSGSLRPMTNSFAFVNPPLIASRADFGYSAGVLPMFFTVPLRSSVSVIV